LFICGGAFDGLEKIIARRVRVSSIGYLRHAGSKDPEAGHLLQCVQPVDLKSYGLIPELLGRLPVVTYLNPLDKNTLKIILTQPKNALMRQYEHLFSLEDIRLVVPDDVLDFVVDQAMELKLGARGLRSILEVILLDAMFSLPTTSPKPKEFIVSLSYARDQFSASGFSKLRAAG
jgi:ATP-dependent Clp protease ATP-binding subunit ClpX